MTVQLSLSLLQTANFKITLHLSPAIPTPSNLALENNWQSLWEKNVYHSILITLITILEPIIENEVSQKEKNKYCILTHIYMGFLGSSGDKKSAMQETGFDLRVGKIP